MFKRKKTTIKKTNNTKPKTKAKPKTRSKAKPKPKKKVKILFSAQPEKCFWICDGQVLKNLKDLEAALAKMSDKVFKYHVNKKKNDFASWVKDVIRKPKLAKDLEKAKTAKAAAKKIKTQI